MNESEELEFEDPDAVRVAEARNDPAALNSLFAHKRERLKHMLRLRLHPRLKSRIDESDIVQELLIYAAGKFQDYAAAPRLPFYLWLRHLAGLKLLEVHRKHLDTKIRTAHQEAFLEELRPIDAAAESMAHHLAAAGTNPSDAAIRQEQVAEIRQALEKMGPVDREILALIHFEDLSVSEAALELGLSKAGAGSRYLRALKRLKRVLPDVGPSI